MDQKIVSLAEEGNNESLVKVLNEVEEKKLLDLLDARAIDGKGDPVVLLRAVFKGSSPESSAGLKRKVLICKHACQILNEGGMSSKVTMEMIGLLLLELDTLPGKELAQLADMFLDTIKSGQINSGKSLELFPKVLSAISAKESIPLETDGGGVMSGSEFKSQLLNSLCANRWDSKCVVHLANMFRDVPMSTEEHRFVMEKIIRMLKHMEVEELPPLVYQLLLLSTKGNKRLVIQGIIAHFNQLDERCKEEHKNENSDELVEGIPKDQLRHSEGTVILHITFAMKQDQDLGREFIKYLKAGNVGTKLSAFVMALALSVARIHRFEETIHDYLKAAVLKTFKDAERRKSSKWIHDLTPDPPEIDEMLLETIQNSLYSWDHVTQGLVQLGLNLMDAFGPRTATDTVSKSAVLSPAQKACQLGSSILLNTFKAHDMVRTEILEQILSRVVTKATTPVNHFIDLLSNTVSSAPQILLDSLPRVKEAFDYLSYLPPHTAEGLLKSVQPLMKISPSLKDSLILVLRKAMFSRGVDARKSAVCGFLLILKHFKILGGGFSSSQASQASQSFTSSQVLADIHLPGNTNVGNEGLCLEILGNLRRCFTQQADVRLCLYEGLFDVLKKNKQLQQPILDMVFTQFQRYYESGEDVTPPVKLEQCLSYSGDDVLLSEPLANLLSTLLHCVIKAAECLDSQVEEEDEGLGGIVNSIEEAFQSLVTRMGKCDLEDFELDKSADFSLSSGVGIKNNTTAKLVLGLYEVLIEFTFTAGDFSVESGEEILRLFANHHKLAEILKEKAGAGAGKKGKSSGNKTSRKSILSFAFEVQLVKALLSDTTPDHQGSLTQLRENVDFVYFVLNSIAQTLTQIQDTGSCAGPNGRNIDHVIKKCCVLGRILVKQITGDSCLPAETRKEKGKSVTSLCVEAFCTLTSIMCCRFTDKLDQFLMTIDQNRDSDAAETVHDNQERVFINIKRFQRLLVTITTSNNKDLGLHEAQTIITVISHLANFLHADGQQFAELQDWGHKFCVDQTIDDIAVNKSLLTLQIRLTSQCKSTNSMVKELAQDIHTIAGDIDEDVEMNDDRTNFAAVNYKTATPTTLILLVNHLDKSLDEVDFIITMMKGQITASSLIKTVDDKLSSPQNTQQISLESSVCARLIGLIYAYHELTQSAMPPGPCSENTVKSLIKLYTVLGTLTKYYLTLYGQKLGHISAKFEKLARLTGTHLAQQVYALMTYIQSAQAMSLTEQSQTAKNKAKKKNNKAGDVTGKMKVLKEIKNFPNLVYSMEQYERYLIQLSKKCKINLMEQFKRSTSRDFRINGATLEAALREAESEEEEEELGSDTESEPPAKKGKTDEQSKGNKLSKKNKQALKDVN